MPVDKFGRTLGYGSQEYTVKTININKAADFMLNIDKDANRALGCTDLIPNSSFSINLGDDKNKIEYTKDQPVEMTVSHGLKVILNGDSVVDLIDRKISVSRDINLEGHTIKSLGYPQAPTDAANRHFVIEAINRCKNLLRRMVVGTISTVADAEHILFSYDSSNPPASLPT